MKTRKVKVMGKTVEEVRMDTIETVMRNFEMLQAITEQLSDVLDEGSVMEILALITEKLDEADI